MKTRTTVPVQLYRHYDKSGILLYVGISANPGSRFREHHKKSEWAGRSVRMTVDMYPDRLAASIAELRAIEKEKPLYNVGHLERKKIKPSVPCPHTIDRMRRKEPTLMLSGRISLSVIDSVNARCKKTGMSRSALMEQALKKFLGRT